MPNGILLVSIAVTMDEPERAVQQWWSPIGDLVLCSQNKEMADRAKEALKIQRDIIPEINDLAGDPALRRIEVDIRCLPL
jgi:hypothetical protein